MQVPQRNRSLRQVNGEEKIDAHRNDATIKPSRTPYYPQFSLLFWMTIASVFDVIGGAFTLYHCVVDTRDPRIPVQCNVMTA